MLAFALLVCACSPTTPSEVPTAEPNAQQREVIDAVDGMFAAMKSHDQEDLRARVMEGAQIVRVGTAEDGSVRHSIVKDADFVVGTAGDDSVEIDERFTATPQVQIDGPIASLWGPYEVFVDGERKHCGVDIVQLARLDGRWRVTAITYTARACD